MRRKILDQHGMQYLTLTVTEWIDVFTRKEYRDVVIDSLKFCMENKGLTVYAYVIMSNHIHLVVQAEDERFPLSDILRDFKKFTSGQILKMIENSGKESRREWMLYRFAWNAKRKGGDRKYQLWQSSNHPTGLWTPRVVWQKIRYIHRNPVRAGLVAEAPDYLYSSASNYANKKSLLEITTYKGIIFE